MLTSDLVRVTLRKDRIYPRLLDVDDPEMMKLAERLIAMWHEHVGKERREWDEALKDLIGDSPDYLVARGLGKLLDDRSEWSEPDTVEPQEVRRALFELSSKRFPVLPEPTRIQSFSRVDALREVAEQFGVGVAEVEDAMYADRKEEQKLRELKELKPRQLLVRYNLSNTQAILLRALQLRLTLKRNEPKKVRELFRYLKFHRLIYTSSRGDNGEWYVTVDGPMSLFSQSQRYGLQMALFLPSLLLLEGWKLRAEVRWPQRDHHMFLELDDSTDLETWKRSRGTWTTDEEKMLRDRIGDGRGGWTAEDTTEIVQLDGGDVLVPDFVMEDNNGQRVFVEIVGYWRKAYLQARMDRLKASAPDNLVMCISRKLTVDEEIDDAPLHYVDYAQVIPITKFMEAVKAAAEAHYG